MHQSSQRRTGSNSLNFGSGSYNCLRYLLSPISEPMSRVRMRLSLCFFFFQAEDGIRDYKVTGVQTCALPILHVAAASHASWVYDRGSPGAPPNPTGWKPVQLVPENARAGRGGLPITVAPNKIGRASCRERV